MSDIPFSFSHIPGSPSFRNSAVNAVALVPLLSRNKDGDIDTKSVKSFHMLAAALGRHTTSKSRTTKLSIGTDINNKNGNNQGLLVIVPNSSLTRPGDWRYNDTPLKGFHWQHGCQRLRFFDGRPQHTRLAHDRLMNHFTRDWIDIFPSRRTAAVIGVLNMHDCHDLSDLHRAEEELHQWANRYSTPPYEVTALGRSFERDNPVERLFVFDSFDEECQKIDLSKSSMENSILAFPPAEEEHSQMMDLHLNVVVNDLAVAIFRNLEARIMASDAIGALSIAASQAQEPSTLTSSARISFTRIMSGSSQETSSTASEEPVSAANRLSLSNMANIVSPDSKLAGVSPKSASVSGIPSSSFTDKSSLVTGGITGSSFLQLRSSSTSGSSSVTAAAAAANANIQKANSSPKLITPLDAFWEKGGLSARDVDAIRRRDVSRREKWAADMSLLAGSPLDAYERYVKAAEMCKSGTPDPLWYASALEGCAAAHIAMAEAGGFGVDEYLENNFQMPEEIMALLTRDDSRRPASSASSNKQTLPEIVFALCDEALNITNRHEKLGAFHAELLLKLAYYVSESSEGHLRCRWGEGDGCYAGEVDDVPRWLKPTVARLKFTDLSKSSLENMIAINSVNRTKQVCELLHEAVSVGPLDPPTRVDVAACCVRLCLTGVKATQWKGIELDRMRLPRKAAFFAVVAAEAMTESKASGGDQTSRDLWLLATHLFSKSPNLPGRPGGYGWAGLRAITLNALSVQGNSPLSLKAAEQLLSLLSEITPPSPQARAPRESPRMTSQGAQHSGHGKGVQTSSHGGKSIQTSGHGMGSSPPRGIQSSGHGGKAIQTSGHGGKPSLVSSVDQGDVEAVNKSASAFAKQLRESFTSLTAGSSILVLESKWANNDIVDLVDVPLAVSSVQPMGCVWSIIDQEKCSAAQTRCLNMISKLHRSLPTGSETFETPSAFLPIAVSSGMSIQVEQDLELERAKMEVKKDQEGSADPMATFFNPFANKRTSKAQTAVVAEGEERTMCVELSNRLSIPVTVIRCQLQFKNDLDGRVKATPLSFTIPSKATGFPVHFPFCILPSPGSSTEETTVSVFEVAGLKLTFAGRVFLLPISPEVEAKGQKSKKSDTREIPSPASLYVRSNSKVASGGNSQDGVDSDVPRIESCPPQPRLQVCLAKSGAPLDAERPISICLAEGELYTLPTLRLKNYLGPSGFGRMDRLQIFAVDLPGLSDKKIYDSDVEVPADQDFVPRLGKDQPALKLRCLATSLKLEEINECHGSGSLVTCQIAASHLIQKQIPKGATIKLRFRYRGAPGAANEFWRRREVSLRVACVSGPRISSLDFRSDLLTGSAYADFCRVLIAQKNVNDIPGVVDKCPVDESADVSIDDKMNTDDLLRIGMDKGINVASKDVIFVLTVANETSSTLIISKENGDVGGFPLSPIRTLQVNAGVSAKFPVVVPRIQRSPASSTRDLVKEVIAITNLRWEIEREESDGDDPNSNCEMAKGHLHIPSACLQDIIDHHPSFVSRICEPPCCIELFVQGSSASSSLLSVRVGTGIDVSAKVSIAGWVPAQVFDNCRLVLEFLCARKGRRSASCAVSRDFVWCGKTRQPLEKEKEAGNGDDDNGDASVIMQHRTKLVFCASGTYAVSACARLQYASSKEEEIWLAPTAITVHVDKIQQQQ